VDERSDESRDATVERLRDQLRRERRERERLGQVFVLSSMNTALANSSGEVDSHEIRTEAFADGDAVVVETSDTGREIPPEEIDFVFDRFLTMKAGSEGFRAGRPNRSARIDGSAASQIPSSTSPSTARRRSRRSNR